MNSSRKRAREGERDGACRSDLMRGGRGGEQGEKQIRLTYVRT